MSRFVGGGPLDGIEREVPGQALRVMEESPLPVFSPKYVPPPIVVHTYESRLGGTYFEYVGRSERLGC